MSKLPPLEYGHAEPTRKWYAVDIRAMAIIAISTAAILAMAMVLLESRMSTAVEQAHRIRCSSNLRQIAQAIQLYAFDNQGLFPPDARTLKATQQISFDCFICDSTADTAAKSLDELAVVGHLSYIYAGADFTTHSAPKCIVALDDPANHNLEGGNVLFADGHVEFLNLPTIQHILNELSAGRNPPSTLTPTLSQSAAEKDYQTNWKSRMPQLKTGVWRIPTIQPTTDPQ